MLTERQCSSVACQLEPYDNLILIVIQYILYFLIYFNTSFYPHSLLNYDKTVTHPCVEAAGRMRGIIDALIINCIIS